MKLLIIVTGNGIEDMDDENFDTMIIPHNSKTDVSINKNNWTIEITPFREVLVPEEEYVTSEICLKPNVEGAWLNLHLRLLSSDFQKEEKLQLDILTKVIKRDIEELVEDPLKVGVFDQIEDCIEEST